MTEEFALRALANVKQMAEMLSVSETCVYDLVRKRRVPFVKVGGAYRFEPLRVIKHLREEPEEEVVLTRSVGSPKEWKVLGGDR